MIVNFPHLFDSKSIKRIYFRNRYLDLTKNNSLWIFSIIWFADMLSVKGLPLFCFLTISAWCEKKNPASTIKKNKRLLPNNEWYISSPLVFAVMVNIQAVFLWDALTVRTPLKWGYCQYYLFMEDLYLLILFLPLPCLLLEMCLLLSSPSNNMIPFYFFHVKYLPLICDMKNDSILPFKAKWLTIMITGYKDGRQRWFCEAELLPCYLDDNL